MKSSYFIGYIIILLFISCNKNTEPIEQHDNIEDCVLVGDFYARMLINGKCFVTDSNYFRILDNTVMLEMIKIGQYYEELTINMPVNYKIGETYYFYSSPDFSFNFYVTSPPDANISSFFPDKLFNNDDWFIINSINNDSTIIEGNFKLTLYKDNPQGNQTIYPNKMVITDGQFRAKKFEY